MNAKGFWLVSHTLIAYVASDTFALPWLLWQMLLSTGTRTKQFKSCRDSVWRLTWHSFLMSALLRVPMTGSFYHPGPLPHKWSTCTHAKHKLDFEVWKCVCWYEFGIGVRRRCWKVSSYFNIVFVGPVAWQIGMTTYHSSSIKLWYLVYYVLLITVTIIYY